jgi:hypothetical protein
MLLDSTLSLFQHSDVHAATWLLHAVTWLLHAVTWLLHGCYMVLHVVTAIYKVLLIPLCLMQAT